MSEVGVDDIVLLWYFKVFPSIVGTIIVKASVNVLSYYLSPRCLCNALATVCFCELCGVGAKVRTVGANIMFPCEVRSSRSSYEVEAKFVRS